MRPRTAREVAHELRVLGNGLETRDATEALVLVMGELFGEAATERRALLAEALSREAPSRIEALRRTLEPGAVLRQPSMAEPVLVLAPPAPRKTRRSVIFAGALLATVAAGSAVVGAGAGKAPVGASSAATTATNRLTATEPRAAGPTPSATTTTTPTGVTATATATGATRTTTTAAATSSPASKASPVVP